VDRLLAPRLLRRYRDMERAALSRADVVVATTSRDAAVFRSMLPPTVETLTIPTGLDTDYFVPQPDVAPEPRNVVFYGALANPMNRDAVEFLVHEILPALRVRVPDVRLTLVGSSPQPEQLEMARRDPAITLTGWVEDVRAPLARAAVVVCPLRFGYGIRGRIFELLSMQVPVVATSVAVAGMELESGDGCYWPTAPKGSRPRSRTCSSIRTARRAGAAGASPGGRAHVDRGHLRPIGGASRPADRARSDGGDTALARRKRGVGADAEVVDGRGRGLLRCAARGARRRRGGGRVFWIVVILGIVEGLTEFLPVSSTGHLILVGHWLGYTGAHASIFEVVIQVGAILAVVWEYRAKLFGSLATLGQPTSRRFYLNLIIAFLPAAVLGFIFHDAIKERLFGPRPVAYALLAGAAFIVVVEKLPLRVRSRSLDAVSPGQAFGIGIAQCAALFPGFSRAAATILGGLIAGLDGPLQRSSRSCSRFRPCSVPQCSISPRARAA
jgi:hypothetical protein